MNTSRSANPNNVWPPPEPAGFQLIPAPTWEENMKAQGYVQTTNEQGCVVCVHKDAELVKAARWVVECWGSDEDEYFDPDMDAAVRALRAALDAPAQADKKPAEAGRG